MSNAKLTKAQLIDQLSALRQHCDRVETKLAVATAPRAPRADARIIPAGAPGAKCWSDRYGRTFRKDIAMVGGRSITTNVRIA